ncbi:MAG: PIG-L family deacetylase [Sulfuricurvum sp.]|uniref:PIG-L deacetylase family protein n=1 Tax=Sulfuricurvum sp. TaxID=2025608 RepID=UPI0026082D8C|nr:PIG-L deacetylase family protein [Sulfuricurvum sp.]MDD2830180.1 PIG-L family deacetylase [Sulfuricurvum sp.]MDD4949244.1 PIG-L family deacetylase [Sulfuricurvum sp.]
MKRILIVAAHPDDEVLGCFGTVARLISEGYEAYTLILGEGITSRADKRNPKLHQEALETLHRNIHEANNSIGIKKVFIENFPDNRFDSVDLLDIIKVITSIKEEIQPQIIFTHYPHDLNIDHQITYQAVLTATRPMSNECVREIYAFEVLSSTEWNYPLSFSPDLYYDITNTLPLKVKAMEHYHGELRDFPHPRSLEGIELVATYWGMRTGISKAEAFKTVRMLR